MNTFIVNSQSFQIPLGHLSRNYQYLVFPYIVQDNNSGAPVEFKIVASDAELSTHKTYQQNRLKTPEIDLRWFDSNIRAMWNIFQADDHMIQGEYFWKIGKEIEDRLVDSHLLPAQGEISEYTQV